MEGSGHGTIFEWNHNLGSQAMAIRTAVGGAVCGSRPNHLVTFGHTETLPNPRKKGSLPAPPKVTYYKSDDIIPRVGWACRHRTLRLGMSRLQDVRQNFLQSGLDLSTVSYNYQL